MYCQTRFAFASFQDCCERLPQYLSNQEALELSEAGMRALHFYLAASNEAVSQRHFGWLMLPKAHLLNHLCLDLQTEHYNFRFFHNFVSEDMMGQVKVLCAKCAGIGMSTRVLKRTLLRLVADKPRSFNM